MDASVVLPLAAKLAVPFEGFRSAPYQDSGGVWTIGYGSTWVNGDSAVGVRVTAATEAIDEATALQWLATEMSEDLPRLESLITVELTNNQGAALLDFIYNEGPTAFRNSTLRAKLNKGDFAGAAAEFPRWVYCKGRKLDGLVRRRAAEQALFNTPDMTKGI